MKHLSVLLLISLSFLVVCFAAPFKQEDLEDDPEFTAGYFEGDIMLDVDRNGIKNMAARWPNQTVYYKLSADFDEDHRNHIIHAMEIIESVSCIQFNEVDSNQSYYVNITAIEGGCYSTLGWSNDHSVRKLNLIISPLNTGCFRLGVIMHELLHTLGFFHMHNSWNRDDYIQILEENIKPGKNQFFKKYDQTIVEDFNIEYDYGSIMHYGAYGFSSNGEKTIVALHDEEGIMGQRRRMSESDIKKLNAMYNCSTLI